MKRLFYIVLSAVLLTGLLTGCANKKNTASDATNGTTGTLTVQKEDTMNLNMLLSLMSTPDHGVTELLGKGTNQKYNADDLLVQREYSGIVYGKHIIFTISYNEYGDVTRIDVTFEDKVTKKQLTHIITDLVGRKPKEDGKWLADTATVSIVDHDGHPGLLLEQFVVESAEDVTQY